MASNNPKGDDHTQVGSGRNRGFASMDEDKHREIASKGGKAAHEKNSAHELDPESARAPGHKGGESSHSGNSNQNTNTGSHSHRDPASDLPTDPHPT